MSEIELSVAYEAFRAELVGAFVQLGAMHASPYHKRMSVDAN